MSRESDLRAAIIAEAISWELTRYESHQRVKGVAVDCAQIIAAVYSAVGIIPDVRPQYGAQWMLHRDEELYLAEIRRWSREIPIAEAKPADLLVWKFGRTFSHSGIIIDPGIVLHAWARVGRVCRSHLETEEELKVMGDGSPRPVKAFSVFGRGGRLLRKGKR